MFTGIVERIGKVKNLSSNKLEVQTGANSNGSNFDVKLGDSVCVNGACLTVSNINGDSLSFDVSPESLGVTTLKDIRTNDVVNLERAVSSDGRFGGHFVTGHVDSVGKVSKVVKNGNVNIDMFIEFDKIYSAFLVDKGSVCVNGVSLTVNEIEQNVLRLTLIPYTLKETNLLSLKIGDAVNIEFDVLAKYVANMLKGDASGEMFEKTGAYQKPGKSTLTEEKLRSLGYVK
jgi:riboflavin synthase